MLDSTRLSLSACARARARVCVCVCVCVCARVRVCVGPLGRSGWGKLWRKYRRQLCNTDISQCVTTRDIKSGLESQGVAYRSYELPSHLDISECFVEGSEKGELLLDFLTEVLDFSRTAPAELKAGVLEMLQQPDCSVETDGKIIFNNSLEALVLDPLP